MNKIWEYMGREYPFDITSAETRDSVCIGFEGLSRVPDNGDGICNGIAEFFDTVFGAGSGCKICGEADSAEAHISAYISFIGFMCGQVDEFARIREEMRERV